MQLDYTAIIPNDRFEKPVDRDDDVTQEESYVVVCVCVEEMCLCGGVNSIGKTKSISIRLPSTILFRRFEMGRAMLFVEESLHKIFYSKNNEYTL